MVVPKMCHLACPLRPLWLPGGPLSDSGALGSTRKETLGPMDFMVAFTEFFRTIEAKYVSGSRVFTGHVFKDFGV